AGGWEPAVWIGAPAPGGLALPSALPSASRLYAPRGVWLGDDLLVVADSGNHRVLIWHGLPAVDGTPADVVLGQADATSEGPAAAGRGPERGLRLPTGVLVTDGRLVVADAWHHRVLVWDEVPTVTDTAPDLVLGQPDAGAVRENRGGPCGPDTFYWPFGVAVVGGRFYVADTGNRRILGWSDGLPSSPGRLPDLVLGQPDPTRRDENRGGAAGPASFRWPHDLAGTADRLLVADAGNHRLLGWAPHPDADSDADLVLGQPDLACSGEFPYAPGRADVLRFPYAVDSDGHLLAVADTANNRVLLWDELPRRSSMPATGVLGQPSFAETGENRWTRVEADTFCWPYGLSVRGDRLAVADSGNNRVMIWRRV
ncbi:NHL repeat-containing protein, partial [Frankia sp. CcWB3]